ncbi:MAG: hypothetical protein WC052_03635 [Patescibacteria group bacterium]
MKRIFGMGMAGVLFLLGLLWGLALSPLNGWLRETSIGFLFPFISDGFPDGARILMTTASVLAIISSVIIWFLATRPAYRPPQN